MRLLLLVFLFGRVARSNSWSCEEGGVCKKGAEDEGEGQGMGFRACRVVCGSLWPRPASLTVSKKLRRINPHNIQLQLNGAGKEVESYTKEAVERMAEGIKAEMEGKSVGDTLLLSIYLSNPEFPGFKLNQDESYNLTISPTSDGRVEAKIAAESYLGARHGLETLGQMIVAEGGEAVMPEKAEVGDRPAYTYRGILLDTARNFISVPSILRTIDAMAQNKLNTFHWHITDTHSFPFESPSFPKLHETGAYSKKKVYTQEDIKKVVRYGKVRGVRVLPELDAPAHVGEGWQWAGENVTVCFGAQPWREHCVEPPCGQLNPTSDQVYKILEGIYKDMEEAFGATDLFHMGGDEVSVKCWNASKPVIDGLKQLGLGRTSEDFHTLWSKFQDRALGSLEKATGRKRPVILWTSTLTESGHADKYLDKDKYIIQIWTKGNDPIIRELVEKGFPIIMSNYDALYFDCGFSAWVGDGNNWCSPYIPWQKVYGNDPKKLVKDLGVSTEKADKLVLGAEAALWTEQADDSSLDTRLWPRAAALGEALWRGQGHWEEALPRFVDQRDRLVRSGVTPNRIQPEWCTKHQGACL